MAPLSRHFNLQRLILALATLSALMMLGNALWASFQVQRKQLIDNTLEANRVYANKLAQTTQHFVLSAQQQLAYGAERMGSRLGVEGAEADEADRLRRQTDSFNSIAIVDADGVVRATSPAMPQLDGKRLTSAANEDALARRSPFVSDPFVSTAGNLIVTISHPVFDEAGVYNGYVAASIRLKQKNVLHSLLGTHFYRDGSYLYVVGRDGRLLYHPDTRRIGESARGNEAVQAVCSGRTGALQVTNSAGIQMLAGYAPVPAVGWGVVAQRPLDATLVPLGGLMSTVLRNAAPLGLLSLGFIWFFSRRISSPLWQLASNAQTRDIAEAMARVRAVNAWYFEAAQLKKAVLVSFRQLSERIDELDMASLTDPLTQLFNRRGLDRALNGLTDSGTPFGVITFDVDHFKQVNDLYGHDAGDRVIVDLAQCLRANARPQDVLCRYGGEEFLVLLPDVDANVAVKVAERLRRSIEAHPFPLVGQVTISAGVSHCPDTESAPDLAIRQADKALYQAKSAGRNRVILYRKRSRSNAVPAA